MRRKLEPLLCELHAHTQWSDGALALPDLVDLYGRSGFDVLAVTDHVNRSDDPWRPSDGARYGVHAGNHAAYLAEIAAEAERAARAYGLLLIPGLELSVNDFDPLRAAHAVAVGCSRFVDVDNGLEQALSDAREAGAALIAAHPFDAPVASSPGRTTLRFAHEWSKLAPHVDRWELFNREELFGWVARAGLPAVANGDFHVGDHLFGWKTLLPCAKDTDEVLAYLRSSRPAFLTRLVRHADLRPAA
jgi:predicted metal-dependent phosphoesterase TrpH